MDESKGVKEVDFKETVEMLNSGNHKFVWLGREPLDYIMGLLEIGQGKSEQVGPQDIMSIDKFKALEFKNCIFVCYHGNTSRVVAKMLKQRFNVESYSMKGGVTSVVGEIF
jgi:rhodanese-related sulfurtransferase